MGRALHTSRTTCSGTGLVLLHRMPPETDFQALRDTVTREAADTPRLRRHDASYRAARLGVRNRQPSASSPRTSGDKASSGPYADIGIRAAGHHTPIGLAGEKGNPVKMRGLQEAMAVLSARGRIQTKLFWLLERGLEARAYVPALNWSFKYGKTVALHRIRGESRRRRQG